MVQKFVQSVLFDTICYYLAYEYFHNVSLWTNFQIDSTQLEVDLKFSELQ